MQFRCTLPAALLLALSCALSAHAAPQYHLTDLGDLPGGQDLSFAYGINNSGQVVGESRTASGTRGFLWSSATGMQDLSADQILIASGINDSGQITGVDVAGHAFRGVPGVSMEDIGDLPGGSNSSRGLAINSSGQVAGRGAVPATFSHAFRWTSGVGMQDLGELPGADDYSFAWGINDFGSVVGESRAVTIAGFLWSHAFLWTSAGGIQDLGTFDSTSDNVSTAYGINSIGQIVGFSTGNGYHALAWHAFLWTSDAPNGTSGSMIDLGVLPGEGFSEAHAINTAGHVVGDSSLRPFLWTPADGMLELSTLLDSSGAGWNLDRAMSINDANQIVGWGTNPSGATHAFLLTPVPEPGTGVLAVCGAFGVRLVVRRRATAAKRRGRTAWHFSTRIDGQ